MTLHYLNHCADLGSIPEQCMWDFWRKISTGRNFYRVLWFNLSITIPPVTYSIVYDGDGQWLH